MGRMDRQTDDTQSQESCW